MIGKAVCAYSLSDALKMVECGYVPLITRIPLHKLFERARHIYHGAFDFDGTLIPGSQWKATSALMPPSLAAQDEENRAIYWKQKHEQPIRPDLIDLEDPDWFHGGFYPENLKVMDGAWIAETIRLYSEARITRAQIAEVAKTLPPREGALELLQAMEKRVIITFGIEQLIQDWVEHHQVHPTSVAASRLKFNEENQVYGCHINLVASHTKKCAVERFREVGKIDGENLLVIGDSVVDVHMMGTDSFNVLIVPPNELDRKLADFREGNLASMWDRITLILASDSLIPLLNLLNA